MKVFFLQIVENDVIYSPDNGYNYSVEAKTPDEALSIMLKQFVDDYNKAFEDDDEPYFEYEDIQSLDDLVDFDYQFISHDLESHKLTIKSNL